ncbi:hypothetical protein CLV60_104281 [Dyadobacter jiangsuensis]|uniref:Uncharacterized protein n=1 Tax=Dyadobacter jiangsuensis TaxID=1591085 RepID=A0A2P8G8M0_9BACT|nr:hypothetical protein CLV60_104281 [Dyadobacter jiangsuensis]
MPLGMQQQRIEQCRRRVCCYIPDGIFDECDCVVATDISSLRDLHFAIQWGHLLKMQKLLPYLLLFQVDLGEVLADDFFLVGFFFIEFVQNLPLMGK